MYRALYRDPLVQQQMVDTVDALINWRKYDPAVAGGALWSWAAGRPANDIDLWVRRTWGSKKKAKKLIAQANSFRLYKEVEGSDSYGTWTSTYDKRTLRYLGYMPTSHTKVDLILTNFGGVEASTWFDYRHCQVAFSLTQVNSTGAEYYQKANLCPTSDYARDKEFVEKKLQHSLWGSAEAEDKLRDVFLRLRELSDKALKET